MEPRNLLLCAPFPSRHHSSSGQWRLTERRRQWILLLIGSMAIQHIQLERGHLNFKRKADARIALLREVLERLGRGEDVDVERVLGTGNEADELEWEQGISLLRSGEIGGG